jgi:hypothetical protein
MTTMKNDFRPIEQEESHYPDGSRRITTRYPNGHVESQYIGAPPDRCVRVEMVSTYCGKPVAPKPDTSWDGLKSQAHDRAYVRERAKIEKELDAEVAEEIDLHMDELEDIYKAHRKRVRKLHDKFYPKPAKKEA